MSRIPRPLSRVRAYFFSQRRAAAFRADCGAAAPTGKGKKITRGAGERGASADEALPSQKQILRDEHFARLRRFGADDLADAVGQDGGILADGRERAELQPAVVIEGDEADAGDAPSFELREHFEPGDVRCGDDAIRAECVDARAENVGVVVHEGEAEDVVLCAASLDGLKKARTAVGAHALGVEIEVFDVHEEEPLAAEREEGLGGAAATRFVVVDDGVEVAVDVAEELNDLNAVLFGDGDEELNDLNAVLFGDGDDLLVLIVGGGEEMISSF